MGEGEPIMTEEIEPTAVSAEAEAASRFYVPELDGLRFIAFILVFLFHRGVNWIELRWWLGAEVTRSLRENGWVGVQLFFILSGYLITTLLLREEQKYGRVDLRAFWVRRILRIWPLYYLTVLITFIVIPTLNGHFIHTGAHTNLSRHFVPFLCFAGNWSMVFQGPVESDAQSILWSVCVEEQFYLIVPLLVAWLPSKARIPVVLALMAGSIGTRAYLARAEVTQLVIQYNTLAQFDTLLSGVLLAMILGPDPKRWELKNRVLGAVIQVAVLIAAAWVFRQGELGHVTATKRIWDFVAIWMVGSILVANLVLVPSPLRTILSAKCMVWMGRISYGLYMFHEVAFLIRDRVAWSIGWFPFQETLWPIFALAATTGMAWLSYEYMERRFLQLKRGWTRVPSRPV